jgi:urease subunit alpha
MRAFLCLCRRAFFGVKPDMVLKMGSIAAAQMGDPNASIPTPQPQYMRPMFAAFGGAQTASAVTFASQAGIEGGIGERYGLAKPLAAVGNTRGGIGKAAMLLNDLMPKIEVDPETYEVRADGTLLTCEPAEVLAMAQRYFLY